MENRGQVVFFGLMLAIVIIILALALSGPTKEIVDSVRSNATDTGMDCTNSSISDFQNAACMTTDLTIFYFIGGLLFLAGVVISAKVIQG